MNALILNGELEGNDRLNPILEILEGELDSFEQVESVLLHERIIKPCIGCFRCWDTSPGECFQKDDASEIVRKIIHSDLVVFLTPLTFGAYSSELKKIIERSLGILQPGMQIYKGETHHLPRYDKYPSILSVAVTEKPDVEEILVFKKLGERHSLNFYPPHHTSVVFTYGEAEGKIRAAICSFLGEMEAAQ